MTYRGASLMIASPVAAGFAVWLARCRLAPWIVAIGVIGALCGLVIHCRDWYVDLKRYVREREDFNRRLSERS